MGGGGGGSGRVGYAGYIEAAHELMIVGAYQAETFSGALRPVLEEAIAANPYSTQTAVDPSSYISAMFSAVDDFDNTVDNFVSASGIAAEVTSFDVEATRRLDTEAIPKFNSLMRDICFVQTSTFVVGRAALLESKDREVNVYESKLRMDRQTIYIQAKKDVMLLSLDANKLAIAALHDEEQRDAEIEQLDASWKIDTLVRGGQFLGILGGGSMIPTGASKGQSAVAGALTGAAAGAYVGSVVPGIGTAIGAGVGAVLGAGGAFL